VQGIKLKKFKSGDGKLDKDISESFKAVCRWKRSKVIRLLYIICTTLFVQNN